MFFCGIGEIIINFFFGVLNLLFVIKIILKKREREVGIVFEEVVYEFCCEVFLEEKSR